MTKREKIAKEAKSHGLNAVNRVEFQSISDANDPYRLLAAAIILQAAIDELRGQEKFYWDFGQKVWVRNGMREDDYQFYAGLAGLNITYAEFLAMTSKNLKRKLDKCTPDAAGIILAQFTGGNK